MILHSIRLKNIRSYGEGPEGQGVTINFEPGINRVAGKNGAGKSTLIEALGYALFGATPDYQENFKVPTYFLRSGEKAGELDVTFGIEGAVYRVERGIGAASRRKVKVVRLADGFSEGEGDEEVGKVLCRLFKVEKRERLAELFAKLIGIKQGRMNLPFDTTPGGAKAHFEPLLDVAVFRQCYQSLLPVAQRLKEMKQALAVQQAGLEERIRERADSPAENDAARRRCDELAKLAAETKSARQLAAEQRDAWLVKQRLAVEAEQAAQAAQATADLAAEKFRSAEDLRQRAQNAVQTVAETTAAHEAYLAAEAALKTLSEQQQQKNALDKKKAAADQEAATASEQAKAAEAQAIRLNGQIESKEKDLTARAGQLTEDRKKLDDTETDFQLRLAESDQLQRAGQALKNWLSTLARSVVTAQKQLSDLDLVWNQAGTWNPQQLADLEAGWRQAQAQRDLLQQESAAAKSRATSLAEQLKQIGGGICPFLKEQCRQFDPAKVGNDLAAMNRAAAELAGQLKSAQAEWQKAEQALNSKRAAEKAALAAREQVQFQTAALLDSREVIFEAEARAARALLRQVFPQADWPEEPNIPPHPAQTPGDLAAIRALAQDMVNANDWGKAFAAVAAPLLAAGQNKLALERDQRAAEHKRMEIEAKSLTALRGEIDTLAEEQAAQASRQQKAAATTSQRQLESQRLEQALQAFAQLEQQTHQAQAEKTGHQAAHHRYLAAKPAADDLALHQQNANAAKNELEQANKLRDEKQAASEQARAGFNPTEFAGAQEVLRQADNRLAVVESDLVRAQADATKAAQRFAEWQAAARERETLTQNLRQQLAALQITEQARVILRDTAPMVAQNLCHQIAAYAQEIFNQLNHEPAQLAWEADSYSLRVNPGPKEKRFAMLSGGEQTKLALAMTLAMIRKLIDCKFAIFDEPTYGADADSRHKIADAVVAVQASCRFDQLLLVSHDDAFDGKIEHVVTLVKSVSTGTQAEGSDGAQE